MMKWIILIILLLVLILVLFGIRQPKEKEHNQLGKLQEIADDRGSLSTKKVIYLMIDSLMMTTMKQEIEAGRLPALRFLTQHAQTVSEMVSPFPTMSVTIDSTLLTGTNPNQHGIPGLNWYRPEEKRVVNYGTGAGEAFQEGPNQVLRDALLNLNQVHLSNHVSTLYEELAQRGISSGSINGMIYRGHTEHTLTFPTWLHLPTSLKAETKVKGPDLLAFGAFANPFAGKKELPTSLLKSIGFSDAYPIAVTQYLIEKDLLPSFLFVYLSDLDKPIHKKGPSDTSGLEKLDKEIATLLDSFGSWEKALEDIIWIISGDSGQTKILPADQDPVVPLHSIFQEYQVLAAGETATSEAEVAICVNERMAYVYALQPTLSIQNLVQTVADESRIDLIAWEEEGWIQIRRGGSDRFMRFRQGSKWIDSYDQRWDIEGDPAVLDLSLDQKRGQIAYGDYPDGLNRLAGVFGTYEDPFLVITAKPGYQLAEKHSPKHLGGGGHGSLHRTDSLAPFIIIGTERKPKHMRFIDVKPFLLELLQANAQK